jgi:hypothetical protein
MALERFYKQESQCGNPLHDAAGAELLLLQKITLKSTDVIRAQFIWDRWKYSANCRTAIRYVRTVALE